MTDAKRTEKHQAARDVLPAELQNVFDDFVNDYKFFGTKHYGSPFISYIILAEMVKAGWRPSAEPLKDETDA